jgi:hypothetical protein
MSILGGQTKINPVNAFYAVAGGPPTTFTGDFTTGGGQSFQGYNYIQDFVGGETQLDAVMGGNTFASNTTYLVQMTISFGFVGGGLNTGGFVTIYYGDPDNSDTIGKSYFTLNTNDGNEAGISFCFTLAVGDKGVYNAFSGVYFVISQTGAYADSLQLQGEHSITIYTTTYAISTKANTISDNGLTFFAN